MARDEKEEIASLLRSTVVAYANIITIEERCYGTLGACRNQKSLGANWQLRTPADQKMSDSWNSKSLNFEVIFTATPL